ncbi:MAG: hypothetical protein WC997_11035 [Porticoccaceae bacterium]
MELQLWRDVTDIHAAHSAGAANLGTSFLAAPRPRRVRPAPVEGERRQPFPANLKSRQ